MEDFIYLLLETKRKVSFIVCLVRVPFNYTPCIYIWGRECVCYGGNRGPEVKKKSSNCIRMDG